jgi:hypothetical protein
VFKTKNGKAVKTISATSMNSIYTQFNNWAKAQGSTIIEDSDAVGMMKWQTPKGVAELQQIQ